MQLKKNSIKKMILKIVIRRMKIKFDRQKNQWKMELKANFNSMNYLK